MICNRPPELIDLTDESSSVMHYGQHPNHTSPRSVANTDINIDNNYSQDAANQEANPSNPYGDSQEETPADVAMLLTTIAKTVSKEIETSHMEIQEIADAIPIFPTLYSNATNPPHQNNQCVGMDYEVEQYQDTLDPMKKKTRAVSMDCSKKYYTSPSPPHDEGEETIPTLLQWRDSISGRSTSPPHLGGIHSTPPPSPVVSSRKRGLTVPNSEHRRSNLSIKHHRNRPRSISLAETVVDHIPEFNLNPPDLSSADDKKPKKLILRKKFSWKNYPELEEFLVANREEYLRHSTLNYTTQQKRYNNCLTERMIKLAGEHGYLFCPSEFSFVTVRDRIRCYYKSYVQSMKKKGIVIGYAARKAGLVTEQELEESAHTSGKIFVPGH